MIIAAAEPAKLRTPVVCCLLSSFVALFYFYFLFFTFFRFRFVIMSLSCGCYAVSSVSVAIRSAHFKTKMMCVYYVRRYADLTFCLSSEVCDLFHLWCVWY